MDWPCPLPGGNLFEGFFVVGLKLGGEKFETAPSNDDFFLFGPIHNQAVATVEYPGWSGHGIGSVALNTLCDNVYNNIRTHPPTHTNTHLRL